MVIKDVSSTRLLLEDMRTRSEYMKQHLESMFRAHVKSAIMGRKITEGIKSKGPKYAKNFKNDKELLLSAIKEQIEQVDLVLNDIKELYLLLDMLVSTEQISLQMENQKSDYDASQLLDPAGVPERKYSYDYDHLKILEDSFGVLRIELERQRGFLSQYDIPVHYNEDMMLKEYNKEISSQGNVNVHNLGTFCDTLNARLSSHLKSYHKKFTASDAENTRMIRELEQIKLDPSVFFSPRMYWLLRKMTRTWVVNKNFESTVFYSMIFLLSRLKKYIPRQYYKTIRVLLLINDSHDYFNITGDRSLLVCAHAMYDSYEKLKEIGSKTDKKNADEIRIVISYATNSLRLLDHEMPHISLFREGNSKEEWHSRARDLYSLALEIDTAYRTVYHNKKEVTYDKISQYINVNNGIVENAARNMFSRYEFLINPKGHVMSQYFLEPKKAYKQKNYKGKSKKKGKAKKKPTKR